LTDQEIATAIALPSVKPPLPTWIEYVFALIGLFSFSFLSQLVYKSLSEQVVLCQPHGPVLVQATPLALV
jgi:hypothetical protein